MNDLILNKKQHIKKCSKNYDKLSQELNNKYNTETKGILFFAFSNKQLNEILTENNITTNDLLNIGMGGLLLKNKAQQYRKLEDYIIYTKEQFFKESYYNICGAYYSRLWDYEARISWGEGYNQALEDCLIYTYNKSKDNKFTVPDELYKLLKVTENMYNYEFDLIN